MEFTLFNAEERQVILATVLYSSRPPVSRSPGSLISCSQALHRVCDDLEVSVMMEERRASARGDTEASLPLPAP